MAGLKQFVLGLIRKYSLDYSAQIEELEQDIENVSKRCTENKVEIGDVDVETYGSLQQQVNRKAIGYIESTLTVGQNTAILTDGSEPTSGDFIFDTNSNTLWFVEENGTNHQITLS